MNMLLFISNHNSHFIFFSQNIVNWFYHTSKKMETNNNCVGNVSLWLVHIFYQCFVLKIIIVKMMRRRTKGKHSSQKWQVEKRYEFRNFDYLLNQNHVFVDIFQNKKKIKFLYECFHFRKSINSLKIFFTQIWMTSLRSLWHFSDKPWNSILHNFTFESHCLSATVLDIIRVIREKWLNIWILTLFKSIKKLSEGTLKISSEFKTVRKVIEKIETMEIEEIFLN